MLELRPKMIAVRTSTSDAPCCLTAGIADRYDDVGDNVILRDPVIVNGNMITIVPASICFEFDPNVMLAVNTLVSESAALAEQAQDKLTAAEKLAEFGLEQAAFEIDVDGAGMRDLGLDDAA